jgi:hypothetical protein
MNTVGTADPSTREVDPKVLDVALAEFKALRDEIGSRATSSHTLININVVVSGVVAGLVVNNPGRVALLLLLPIVSPVLGLLWLDHAHNIRNLGDYINATLRPLIVRTLGAGGDEALAWEAYVDRYERRALLRFVPLGVPVLVLFAGVPLASLARTVNHVTSAWQWLLWVSGALLTLGFITLWARLILQPIVTARREGRAS